VDKIFIRFYLFSQETPPIFVPTINPPKQKKVTLKKPVRCALFGDSLPYNNAGLECDLFIIQVHKMLIVGNRFIIGKI